MTAVYITVWMLVIGSVNDSAPAIVPNVASQTECERLVKEFKRARCLSYSAVVGVGTP